MTHPSRSNTLTTMQRLKRQTQSHHQALEQKMDWRQLASSGEAYRRLLRRYYGFYLPLEACLERLDWSTFSFDFETRRKTPLLVQDLQFLGDSPAALTGLPLCHTLPDLDDFAQAWGCLYVLEGSTLGGQVILRFLNLSETAGGRFFNSYGDKVGPMWKAFGQTLNAYAAGQTDRETTLIAAACNTFKKFDRWLWST